MKRVNYEDKQIGDVLLIADGNNELSKLIIDAEKELAPGLDWYPSHVAINYGGGYVLEAWLDLHHNSAACLNPISKYSSAAIIKEVWRPEGTQAQMGQALHETLVNLGPELYSVPDLVGFLMEALARGIGFKDAPNPIRLGYVCSETGLYYLRELNSLQTSAIALGPLSWTMVDEAIRNVSPANLRALFLRHEVKA